LTARKSDPIEDSESGLKKENSHRISDPRAEEVDAVSVAEGKEALGDADYSRCDERRGWDQQS